ncbi:DUF4012 domain-containing protein [Nocardioides sp. cx-173]|uniref:DUF4012 domain-containing protein n=1 Tax=Nocardioides sp. cx-173 TaxID=2898796 RepID=UPI001E48A276|nr:DUF4012 domain-containing protein [Nocardioides sp. cx-173]MCD4526928.1 DUF4012 domain-containing protein [Nocardioides sp. cx-173]UGB41284.1 DUF4012 domain-containing protein [Nocardioides sp. cx-173]
MRPTRPVRFLLLALLGLVVLGGAWVGWQAWQVNRDLSAAAADAQALQAAVQAGNDVGTDAALAALQDHSAKAAERTQGKTWSLLTHVPSFGDDARGVRTVSGVMADLSDDIEPLTTTATDLEAILPRDGQIPLKAVAALQKPVAQGAVAFGRADERLSGEDSSGFIQPLKTKYRDLAKQVSDVASGLASADTALRVMPAMLGQQGPRNYLLVFQNNAEIRATGGLPGAVSVVRAEAGKVEMTRQVATNTIPKTAKPILPLTKAEYGIYDTLLGTYFVDSNFTADFPRTAELMKAHWENVYDDDIDGVLSLDPVALSYILKATGPIQVGDVALSSENVVDELLHQTYLRLPVPIEQDAFFREVARAVFERVSSGVGSPEELIRALARGTDEHRLYVHSFDEEQQLLSGTQVAGELVRDPKAAPQVGFYINDATGAKMSYFLRYDVQVDATYCKDGTQGLSGTAHLTSAAPEDAAKLPDYITGAGNYGTKPGAQTVLINLYAPVGGTVSDVQLNGEALEITTVVEEGRPVALLLAQLPPRFTVDLSWRMTTGANQRGDTEVSVTPGVVAGSSSSHAPSACF